MSKSEASTVPEDPKAWLFYHALGAYNALVPRKARSFVKLMLFQIAPDIPVSLTTTLQGTSLTAVFVVPALVTFILCFVVVVLWSSLVGTFAGDDPSRLYFSQDWVNIANYAILCPLIAGFGAVLVASAAHGWADLEKISGHPSQTRLANNRLSAFLLLLIVLAAALFFNAMFMADNLDSTIYPRVYWFVDHVTAGTRVIGAFGFYYGLLNFCLLLYSLFVVAIFVSEFRLVVQIADSIDRINEKQRISTEGLRARLASFTQAYLAGKLVVACYMINAFIWKSAQVHRSTNLIWYGAALTFFGMVFLSFPRYYIELQWFRLSAAERDFTTSVGEYQDLRPSNVEFVAGMWKPRLVAHVIDWLFIGSFAFSFWL